MLDYRAYTIDADNHVAGPSAVMRCLDDQHAVRQAHALLDHQVIEVWQRDRLVARITPHRPIRRYLTRWVSGS